MEITDEEKAALFAEFQASQAAQASAPQDRASVVGVPEVDPEAGPEYYLHLANGDVVESHDSGSTHVEVDGVPVLVIGRYQKGAQS